MVKKKKPAKKPAPAKKKPPRKPTPQGKKPKAKPAIKPRRAAPVAGARSRSAHSAMSVGTAGVANGICTINQPDGSAPLPAGPINVVVTVNQPSTQVCGVRTDIVAALPGDPLEPSPGAVQMMRDFVDPTKWNGVVNVMNPGNYSVAAWPCTITDRCTRAIQVVNPTPPPPPPPAPPS